MSAPTCDIKLTVNGEQVTETVEARKSLVDFLRDDLALTGSHVGCEHGFCGACTVRINGVIVRGCLTLAVQCDGARVETIEGMSDAGEIADLQAAFEKRNALQCGFCTPGMLLTAQELLSCGKVPSREQIRNTSLATTVAAPAIRPSSTRSKPWHRRARELNDENRRGQSLLPHRTRPAQLLYRPLSAAPNLARLTQGRAQYVSDVTLPRMAHVAFVRSPHAHAQINHLN
jgi:carbon-monoxide dehydrogenase small subunit